MNPDRPILSSEFRPPDSAGRIPASGACDYCGLPLPRTWWGRCDVDRPQYCCSGCRAAAEWFAPAGDRAPHNRLLGRLGMSIFLTMNVVTFTMALWVRDVYQSVGDEAALQSSLEQLIGYLLLLLSLPVLALLGGPLAAQAWQQLRRGAASSDLLLLLGVAAAYAYSIASVLSGRGHLYFEVGCVVLVLVTLGRHLESTGKVRATAALESLARLLPEWARRLVEQREILTPLAEVQLGDRLLVLAGERVPCDGRVASGRASVDTQVVTGESQPVVAREGDWLAGGTLNLDGQIVVEVSAPAAQGTVQRMVDAVRQARWTRGFHQRLSDRVSAWFLPLALLAALGALAWHAPRSGWDAGLLAALSVVLIACPCALGLATPLAVWCALGRASRRGTLFRHGEAIERLARVRAVYVDKTGTLSTGQVAVTACQAAHGQPREELLALAGLVAAQSIHPLAVAVAQYCRPYAGERSSEEWTVETLPGEGVIGRPRAAGREVVLGSLRLAQQRRLAVPPEISCAADALAAEGASLVLVGWEGQVRGVFALREQLRPEAADALDRLKQLGLAVQVLTGDHAGRAAALAPALGVSVLGELLPLAKVDVIRQARAAHGAVAMVGDGINDAPALAAADVGLALGSGADVARESADVCLLHDDLARVPEAIELARRTVRIIRQNLFWALVYNVGGVWLACRGWLNPIWASAAMAASSLVVVSNSLRLSGGAPGAAAPGAAADATAENLAGVA